MKSGPEIVQYIEVLIFGSLDRPQMYAENPDSLETLLFYLDAIRSFSVLPHTQHDNRDWGYPQFLVSRGYGSASVASRKMSQDQSATFDDITGMFRQYLSSPYFPGTTTFPPSPVSDLSGTGN